MRTRIGTGAQAIWFRTRSDSTGFLLGYVFVYNERADDSTKEDRFQTQKGKGFMAGQVCKDERLAKTVVTDCRKKWCCCFCSENNVWSIAMCRRYKTDIPTGLNGKHLQAVSTRNGRS